MNAHLRDGRLRSNHRAPDESTDRRTSLPCCAKIRHIIYTAENDSHGEGAKPAGARAPDSWQVEVQQSDARTPRCSCQRLPPNTQTHTARESAIANDVHHESEALTGRCTSRLTLPDPMVKHQMSTSATAQPHCAKISASDTRKANQACKEKEQGLMQSCFSTLPPALLKSTCVLFLGRSNN